MENNQIARNYNKDGWALWDTGGGCIALGKKLSANDSYLLITDEWGMTIDGNMETGIFMLGIYTENGDNWNTITGSFQECIIKANTYN